MNEVAPIMMLLVAVVLVAGVCSALVRGLRAWRRRGVPAGVCPSCREAMQAEASVCPHCRSRVR
jgi:predicted amidophosphoribosyltransferase